MLLEIRTEASVDEMICLGFARVEGRGMEGSEGRGSKGGHVLVECGGET